MGTPVHIGDRVLVQTSTTGTGTYQLGAALTGYQTFAAAGIASGARVAYLVVDSLTAPTQWEISEGIYTSGSPPTLTRAMVKRNHLGTSAAVNWAAGTKYVAVVLPADRVPVLDSVGFLGLGGVASPQQQLHIKGGVQLEGTTAATGAMLYLYYISSTNAAYLTTDASGNVIVGIGTSGIIAGLTLDSSGNLTIAGPTAIKPGGGTWAAPSDARLKENIRPLTDAAARVMALRPRVFDMRDGSAQDVRGFIAQEIAEVYPSAVTEGADGMLSVSLPMEVLADLVAFAQHMASLGQQREAAVTALEARVAALEAMLAAPEAPADDA
ncbi:tail fiber domain-containing protein [Crenalkalicoccus roseus]|uniref:tail fiber domain-containing protein n=1 Tax=Crenalkalicoccus roseus TaxID=1485588 RepID=UPI0010822001|nr:tail fiber domain-containing protein [Crenalkalicoccus roseus]